MHPIPKPGPQLLNNTPLPAHGPRKGHWGWQELGGSETPKTGNPEHMGEPQMWHLQVTGCRQLTEKCIEIVYKHSEDIQEGER